MPSSLSVRGAMARRTGATPRSGVNAAVSKPFRAVKSDEGSNPSPPLLMRKPAIHAGLRLSETLAVQSTGVRGSPPSEMLTVERRDCRAGEGTRPRRRRDRPSETCETSPATLRPPQPRERETSDDAQPDMDKRAARVEALVPARSFPRFIV